MPGWWAPDAVPRAELGNGLAFALHPTSADDEDYAAERPQGRFTRALSLPDDVDTAKVEAKYRDGVLQVSIGLREGSQPQRITVQ